MKMSIRQLKTGTLLLLVSLLLVVNSGLAPQGSDTEVQEEIALIQRELPTCKGGDESMFLYLPFVL
jgi:hypothetical protein